MNYPCMTQNKKCMIVYFFFKMFTKRKASSSFPITNLHELPYGPTDYCPNMKSVDGKTDRLDQGN